MTSASFRGKAKETPLNSNAIENILTFLTDLNPTWLITGTGKMLSDSNVNQKIKGNNNTQAGANVTMSYDNGKIEKLEE